MNKSVGWFPAQRVAKLDRERRSALPKVLLVWELGDGLGHVTRLLPLARALRAQGIECVVAARNVITGGRLVSGAGFPVFQSPHVRPERRGPLRAIGDVLATIGYLDPNDLEQLVRSWSSLIQALNVDLIIADYSPTACLAAFGDVPVISLGDSFTLPPVSADGEFEPFQPGTTPAIKEGQILDVVKVVQQRRLKRIPSSLAECLLGDRQFIVTLPELCFRTDRSKAIIGPIGKLPAPSTGAPSLDFFGYLSATAPGVAKVLTALSESGLSGSVYLRDASSDTREQWRLKGLHILDDPAEMASTVSRAALLVHHGGLGTCEFGLAIGRPQLVIPRHQEQAMNAACLRRLKVAVATVSGGRFEVEHINAALAQVRKLHYYRAAAYRAQQIARSHHGSGLATLVQSCEAFLKARASGAAVT